MNVVLLSLFFAFTCAVYTSERNEAFEAFIKKYEKNYSLEEYENRQSIFTQNVAYIAQHNGQEGVLMSVNEFADMTLEEFRAAKLVRKNDKPMASSILLAQPDDAPLPPSWNWVTKGGVTPVANQGQTGA
jgi:C1A family cysteine protease